MRGWLSVGVMLAIALGTPGVAVAEPVTAGVRLGSGVDSNVLRDEAATQRGGLMFVAGELEYTTPSTTVRSFGRYELNVPTSQVSQGGLQLFADHRRRWGRFGLAVSSMSSLEREFSLFTDGALSQTAFARRVVGESALAEGTMWLGTVGLSVGASGVVRTVSGTEDYWMLGGSGTASVRWFIHPRLAGRVLYDVARDRLDGLTVRDSAGTATRLMTPIPMQRHALGLQLRAQPRDELTAWLAAGRRWQDEDVSEFYSGTVDYARLTAAYYADRWNVQADSELLRRRYPARQTNEFNLAGANELRVEVEGQSWLFGRYGVFARYSMERTTGTQGQGFLYNRQTVIVGVGARRE